MPPKVFILGMNEIDKLPHKTLIFFSHKGMLVRAALTALDHNSNTERLQVLQEAS